MVNKKEKTKWIIDTTILDARNVTGNVLSAIKNVGCEVFETRYVPFGGETDYGFEKFDGKWYEKQGTRTSLDGPYMLYGTIPFVYKCPISFIPGSYGINENTNCETYYSYLPEDWMLNSNFIMAPFAVIKNNPKRFFEMFGVDDLFIRPASGRKTFTGFVFNSENVEQELHSYKSIEKIPDTTICLVSPAINLKAEFRFVVANREVVDGSEYRWDNILDIRHDWLEDCHKLAVKMANHAWQPDVCYTVDVADTADGPKIIELNGFSCAGLYACDKELVFGRVSDVAQKDFYGVL